MPSRYSHSHLSGSTNLWILLTILSANIILAAPPAPASQPDKTPPSPKEELLKLNFPPNMKVKVFTEYISARLGVNILYDDSIGQKQITILAPQQIPKHSLMDLFTSVLKTAGLQLIDDDIKGWKRIVPAQNLVKNAGLVQKNTAALKMAKDSAVVSQMFELKNTTPVAAETLIRPFLTKPGGNSFTIPGKNLLIVTDFAGTIRRIEQLIGLLDTPKAEVKVQFLPVQYVKASELAKQVTELIKERQLISSGEKAQSSRFTLIPELRTNRLVFIGTEKAQARVQNMLKELDVPTETKTKVYRFRYVAPKRIDKLARDMAGIDLQDTYRSTIDSESGMLIVTAPQRIHKDIAALTKELDIPETDTQTSFVRFYKLMNTTATDVLATIRSLESGEIGISNMFLEALASQAASPEIEKFKGPNSPPSGIGQELPKPPGYTKNASSASSGNRSASRKNASSLKTQDAIVTADTNTNTIIVVAPPNIQRIYEHLIHMLDQRRPQVMIEVTLLTLDTTGGFSLGVELGGSISLGMDDKLVLFSSFGLSTPNIETGSLTLEPGVGLNGSLVSADALNIIIRAVASSGRAKVLSAPRVLVNDNSSATLSSVQESPYTSLNASQTVSTTSFAGYASAGTTIAITPHISEGDHLQLKYSITLNSFQGEGSDGVPPPRQSNSLNSEATIPNGNAIIVGGLTREDISDTEKKIPLLGDIPYLGNLFKLQENSKKKSTLFVFIRPVILRDDEFRDLKYLSDKALENAGMPPHYPQSQPILMQ